jgi:hypothetical protein
MAVQGNPLPNVDETLIDALREHVAGRQLKRLVSLVLFFEDQDPIVYVARGRTGEDVDNPYLAPEIGKGVDLLRYDSVSQILYLEPGQQVASGWKIVSGRHKKIR